MDARNHGDSPQTIDQTYPLMAEDVKLLMESLNVKKASFIGHSMGGRTMMYLAVTYVRFVFYETILIIFMSAENNMLNVFSQNLWNP